MAINLGNKKAMNNLSFYYKSIKDYKNMLKYFYKAYKINTLPLSNESELNSSYILDNLFITNLNQIDDISLHMKYKNYLNKENFKKLNDKYCSHLNFLKLENINIIEECFICFENEYKIELKCKHSICFNCYPKINKCPFCRGEI